MGGNELILDDMIAQTMAKKGYVSKNEIMNQKLVNLNLIAKIGENTKSSSLEKAKTLK